MYMATAARWKKGRKKGKEGKGKIIFSKSLFPEISSNTKPHKIPVLSPNFMPQQNSQESAADPKPGEYAPQPPEYYYCSKSNIHFFVSQNPTTAVFCKLSKIIIYKPVDLACSRGMKTFIEQIRLSTVPFEVYFNLTSQKLPRTIPRKNPTTIVFSEFFKYCKIIQNLAIIAQKPLIYKTFSEFSKNFNFPTIFQCFFKTFPTNKRKRKSFIYRRFTTFHYTFFTELTKSNPII